MIRIIGAAVALAMLTGCGGLPGLGSSAPVIKHKPLPCPEEYPEVRERDGTIIECPEKPVELTPSGIYEWGLGCRAHAETVRRAIQACDVYRPED